MGRYGNGISFKEACVFDREQIVKALDLQVVSGEDEKGFIYCPCTKEDADKTILDLYDNIVYQARQTMAVGRAHEKYLTKKMGKRWMKLFKKGFYKSGYVDAEMMEEFGCE